jgi:hypothetical protein
MSVQIPSAASRVNQQRTRLGWLPDLKWFPQCPLPALACHGWWKDFEVVWFVSLQPEAGNWFNTDSTTSTEKQNLALLEGRWF